VIKVKLPEVLLKMNAIFRSHGHEAYLVGGAVRDMIRGKDAADWDIATDASPEKVCSMFHRVIPTGIAHGTVTVHFLKHEIETTTYRTESSYSDGRHPDSVSFASNIEEDLSRRDFTMNAIAISLETGEIVDPFFGQNDIKHKIIRAVGNPRERFLEDGLRPIRAIRFASQLSFSIEKNTFEAICADDVRKVTEIISLERFRDEFLKILKSEKPSVGLKLLEQTGILQYFIPEFSACRGCIQGDGRCFHDFDVADHLFYACDGAPAKKPLVRLAALLHDIAKPDVKRIETFNGNEIFTFYEHENVGAKKTEQIMTRLKFSNAEIATVCHLVKNHMFHYESAWTDAAVRRFLMRVGRENVEDLFDLRLADVYGMHNVKVSELSPTVSNLNELSDRIKAVECENSALSLKDLAVNGSDLIKIGIKPGKKLGWILNELLESVVDEPDANTKERLIFIAKHLLEESGN
jgi:poly(A) polymerase/tRNA nucleotidyltransferase (CCA-adding enzyme)